MTQIFTAKTVDDAKALAVRAFGAAEKDIIFEVIEEPKKGLFGFMKGEARVRATYETVDASVKPAAPAEPAPAAAEEPSVQEEVAAPAPEVQEEEPAEEILVQELAADAEEKIAVVEAQAVVTDIVADAEASDTSKTEPMQQDADLITGEPSPEALAKIEKAKEYLTGILTQMGIEAELSVNAGSESAMIDISAANNGAVIGKRGETLDALQYLTFMIANRGDKEYYRIILNSANYRERRRKTLEELAEKIAKNVLRSGRQTTLEPMNPYERRIIHSKIAEIEGVSSRSVGEEPYRKVVISSLNRTNRGGRRRYDKNDRNDRSERNNRGRGRDRRRHSDAPPTRTSMDFMKTSFEKDYKRPKPEDDLNLNAGLYGKIEF